MAFEFGPFGEFQDEVTKGDPVIAAVAKVIQPGVYEGALYQAMGPISVPLTQKTMEIYTRSRTSRDGALGATAWNESDTEGLSLAAAAVKGLTIGHVLRIENEVVIIKEVNRTANTIKVYRRGAGQTTAASHGAATPFKVIGYAGADQDLKKVESITETSAKYENYLQTFFETIDWLKHGELVRKGMSDSQAKTVLLKEFELRFAHLISVAAVLGVKQAAGDDTDRYMTAGIISQLTDTNGGKRAPYTYNANGELTDEKLRAAIKEVLDNGGTVNTIWLSPTMKGYANNLCSAVYDPEVSPGKSNANHTAGGIYANAYDYEGLIIPFRVDNAIPNDCIPIVNSGDLKKGWLVGDGLALKDEPQQSSREFRKSLQGTLGFAVENVGVNHTVMQNITGGPTEKVRKVQIQGIGDGVKLPMYQQITVHTDPDVPTAAAANIGLRVEIGTAWTSGTQIATAVKGEVYASNGTAWIKQ